MPNCWQSSYVYPSFTHLKNVCERLLSARHCFRDRTARSWGVCLLVLRLECRRQTISRAGGWCPSAVCECNTICPSRIESCIIQASAVPHFTRRVYSPFKQFRSCYHQSLCYIKEMLIVGHFCEHSWVLIAMHASHPQMWRSRYMSKEQFKVPELRMQNTTNRTFNLTPFTCLSEGQVIKE